MRTSPREVYISVDIEASGPIPGDYSMLSLGACVVGDTARNFYVEFVPLNDNFTPQAMQTCDLSLAELRARGTEPKTAMTEFGKWVQETADGAYPVMVGFNSPFDWSFVNYYFIHFVGKNPLGHSALDIKSYYMGAYHTTWSQTSLKHFPPELNHLSKPLAHNALADAIQQAVIFEKLLSKNST